MQLTTRPRQPRLDRPDRASENLGGLFFTRIEHQPQRHDGTITRLESGERGHEYRAQFTELGKA